MYDFFNRFLSPFKCTVVFIFLYLYFSIRIYLLDPFLLVVQSINTPVFSNLKLSVHFYPSFRHIKYFLSFENLHLILDIPPCASLSVPIFLVISILYLIISIRLSLPQSITARFLTFLMFLSKSILHLIITANFYRSKYTASPNFLNLYVIVYPSYNNFYPSSNLLLSKSIFYFIIPTNFYPSKCRNYFLQPIFMHL